MLLFTSLPSEILDQILALLPPTEVMVFRRVCRFADAYIQGNASLHRAAYRRAFVSGLARPRDALGSFPDALLSMHVNS